MEVYLDHAATTYLDPRVVEAMAPYWEGTYGNPSSLYRQGRKAKEALSEARQTIARILHCQTNELIFTGSGTESDNLALLGVCMAARMAQSPKMHIVTSAIEHSAVLESCRYLEQVGFAVTYLPVDADGLVSVESVAAALREDTLLVSIMYANNEIGTIQPIQEIAALCKNKDILVHTDACQAAGALALNVEALGVDLMTINASKIYGPKGIGLLYVKQGTRIQPMLHGGGQEFGLRSGTENIPAIVGFAKALDLITANQSAENKRLTELRNWFTAELLAHPRVSLNGHPTKRLPNNINISVEGADAEAIVLALDEHGIACATGSACDASSNEPSHVIAAIGKPANTAVRLTLGKQTSKTNLEYVLKQLIPLIAS